MKHEACRIIYGRLAAVDPKLRVHQDVKEIRQDNRL